MSCGTPRPEAACCLCCSMRAIHRSSARLGLMTGGHLFACRCDAWSRILCTGVQGQVRPRSCCCQNSHSLLPTITMHVMRPRALTVQHVRQLRLNAPCFPCCRWSGLDVAVKVRPLGDGGRGPSRRTYNRSAGCVRSSLLLCSQYAACRKFATYVTANGFNQRFAYWQCSMHQPAGAH